MATVNSTRRSHLPEHDVWKAMLQRCRNTNNSGYHKYGGRGITVCNRWLTFENFLEDMGLRPSSKHSIERINNDGNYKKSNCRWATTKEQARNTRRNRMFTHDGRTMCITDWANHVGMADTTLLYRLDRGWPIGKALTVPVQKKCGNVPHNGKTMSLKEWAKETGIAYQSLQTRLRQGWSVGKALTTPVQWRDNLTHDGRTMSLAEWVEETGIAYHTLYYRLEQGWSVGKTLTTPVKSR